MDRGPNITSKSASLHIKLKSRTKSTPFIKSRFITKRLLNVTIPPTIVRGIAIAQTTGRAVQGLLFILLTLFVTSCDLAKKSKSDIEVDFMLDTLDVGYTYWWPEAGPFIGNCGQELSLVFSGTIKELKAPTNEAGPLYTPQRGAITIEQVFKIKNIGENTYKGQRFFTTDCFNGSGLGTGDKVLVVCYDFEDAYTIPGPGSILKIDDFDDDAVTSIRKYIDTDENPKKIEKDIGLWATYGHGRALEDLIACRDEIENPDETLPNANQ